MTSLPSISFSAASAPKKGCLILLTDKNNTLGTGAKTYGAIVTKAMGAAGFKGGFGKKLDIITPQGTDLDRIIVLGLGDTGELNEHSWLRLGGSIGASLTDVKKAAVVLEIPGKRGPVTPRQATDIAQGLTLSAYRFDHYKTGAKKKKTVATKVSLLTKSAAAAKSLWQSQSGVTDGVMVARDLVNEPANVLTPKEFAKRASSLKKLGCSVEILDEKAMGKLKMQALLGVSQGSRNPPRMAIIQWKGSKKKERPIAFVGKGVTFDTGGISIKPSGGMEDMKGDMGGAAAVTGLMHALAARKAKVHAIGIIALVENMPDGDAQRPGDIVTSMSGQTIEIINTDAEGRLILADALWHCNKKFKPKFMINLATLTGAILVALGNQHAGMFSNDDALSQELSTAGLATHERVWRMPLGPEYDKMIDSKNADMKNSSGRYAGSITAGQFLQRFVEKTPWAHLDVAGTAMNSPRTEVSKSWASGFGVRLLDRLVADNYED